ncbi:MAG: aminotransferase class III-fold pyridoxal phosphate-dependent enzyme [Magnetovibrio sp.]|nr:aminotransferase class III-fold pyridoxal phosphate-dependent enzyme [Magnetovibrio sp.]
MDSTPLTNSQIVAAFEEKTRRSKARHLEARDVFPSGIVHDSRHMKPHPIYVERALGPRKWDADGNEYIDYYGGHGSLLLGHAHPSMVRAVNEQIARGTHPAACHELELMWGQLVKLLIPSAERVRFTSSGTEANLMAIRLARAFTGRNKLVRFKNHFHGWQDHVAFGSKYASADSVPGIIGGIIDNVIVADPAEPDAVEATLEGDDDIAAVILEPTGASSGQIPLSREFVKMLREVTKARGIVLIFDEVVTGFRVSPGGAQAALGLLPDLTALAKILSGGLPGGAVCGRRDIMQRLDFEAAEFHGFEKIPHQGTFNANPLSAATGTAILAQVADGDVTEVANRQGGKLVDACNRVFAAEGVPWAAYGQGSSVYFFTNPDGLDIDPLAFDAAAQPISVMETASNHPAAALFRIALLVNGVDFNSKPGAIVSAVHSDDDIAATGAALGAAIDMLKAEGHL